MDSGDLDFVAAMLADPEVMRFWPRCYSRPEAEAWIKRQIDRYAAHGCGYWLVFDKTGVGPIGQAGIMMITVDGAEEPALGYILHRPYWGRGLATEAAAVSLQYALGSLGFERVICPIRPVNVPSLRVAWRLGLKPEKHTTYAGFDHLIFTISHGSLSRICRLVNAYPTGTNGRWPSAAV
jgi:RimJ/RimL family protein N-acetyltransferase